LYSHGGKFVYYPREYNSRQNSQNLIIKWRRQYFLFIWNEKPNSINEFCWELSWNLIFFSHCPQQNSLSDLDFLFQINKNLPSALDFYFLTVLSQIVSTWVINFVIFDGFVYRVWILQI
jgi:hypothetical protein